MLKKSLFFLLSVLTVLSLGIMNLDAQTASIDANTVQQNIRGFGGASILGWINDLTAAQRTTAFSVDNGMGLSVLRVRISPNSGDWANEKATIDAAKSYGATVIASAWSAPASMKDNNNTIGGALLSSQYANYAAHLKSFNTAVGGVTAISPSNEPNIDVTYESMKMTAAQVAAFVAAQGANCGAPIMGPEPFNMDQSFINTYLSTAKSNTAYVCGHIYGVTPSAFNPGKEVWMTEIYVDSNTTGDDWNKAMTVAKQIHDSMNSGYSMYVWWYIRRSYGPMDENGNITKTGYIMSHWAKYVRPGFTKISCPASPTGGVYTTAYKNGSNLVVVAVNQNSSASNVTFNLANISVSSLNRYTTTSGSNLQASSVSASGSSFSVSLPGSSITTLVSSGSVVTPDPTPVPTTAPTGAPSCALKGDVNSNGAVDIVDALLIAQYYVGLNPSSFNTSCADLNCSGAIDIVDALLVAQYYVGLISNFPC
jgi:glucuronoarabinoxylan endo-1,4-beta-xylanase